jgi:hypothetical protein
MEPDETSRATIKALIWVELGREVIDADSFPNLLKALASRRPSILVAAGDARRAGTANWIRFLPVIGLGGPVCGMDSASHIAILDRPIDANHLAKVIATVMRLPSLSEQDGDGNGDGERAPPTA